MGKKIKKWVDVRREASFLITSLLSNCNARAGASLLGSGLRIPRGTMRLVKGQLKTGRYLPIITHVRGRCRLA